MYNPESIKQANDLVKIAEQAGAVFKYVSGEYRSACPLHHGDNKSAFVVFTKAGEQAWNCFTGDCGGGDVITFVQKWLGLSFNDACEWLGGEKKIDPLEIARMAEERAKRQIEVLRAEHEKTERLIQELQRTAKWLEYNRIREENTRSQELWQAQGIPKRWQDFWYLGYCNKFTANTQSGLWTTPTLTIPVFQNDWDNVRDIRHRLLNPPVPNDKYRPETPGVGSNLFFADPIKMYDAERILIVEGEKKAMVTYLTVNQPDLQVIGIPGKKSRKMLFDQFNGQDVWVWLDPDAHAEAEELARNINAKMIKMYFKIDDAINNGILGKRDIYKLMVGARRV